MHHAAKVRHTTCLLLLCFPPAGDSMSELCLRHFRGEYIAYVGERNHRERGAPPSSGSALFHESLAREFALVATHRIPNWPMYEDDLTIWQRRAWPGRPKPRHLY